MNDWQIASLLLALHYIARAIGSIGLALGLIAFVEWVRFVFGGEK